MARRQRLLLGLGLLLGAAGCSTAPPPTPREVAFSWITSPFGVVAAVGTIAACGWLFWLLAGDIRKEAPAPGGVRNVSLLPVRGRWSKYLLAALLVLALSPVIFAILLVVVSVLSAVALWAAATYLH